MPNNVNDLANEEAIHKLLYSMWKFNASDLHLKVGAPPTMRIAGELKTVESPPLTPENIDELLETIMTPEQKERSRNVSDFDFAYQLAAAGRFRINVFHQRGQRTVVCRRVTTEIKSFEELNLPPVLEKIAMLRQGLVIVSGITGSGKSTTLASMIRYINERRHCHIVTVEDPIEYLHQDRKALIDQREVGLDVDSFKTAGKFVLRQDPDVVLFGEMRDPETFESVLVAAETGHLVLTTLHAPRAAQAITRILDLFQPEQHYQIRRGLVFNLRAVVCQMLLPSMKPGISRVPAVEVMLVNAVIRKLISEAQDSKVEDIIKTSQAEGMIDLTQSLTKLVREEFVDRRVAMEVAPNREALEMALRGITVGESTF